MEEEEEEEELRRKGGGGFPYEKQRERSKERESP